DVCLVAHAQVRVPVRRVPQAQAQRAAPLRALRARGGRRGEEGGRSRSQLQQVTAAQRGVGMVRRHPCSSQSSLTSSYGQRGTECANLTAKRPIVKISDVCRRRRGSASI